MIDFSENTGFLLEALSFSAERHRHQRRKDPAQSPYINHPIEVVYVLWKIGGVRDVNVLAAAVLHDTIEDTKTSPQEIADQFGKEVLGLVLEVTDDKSLPKAERKRLQVKNAPHKSLGAKLIKLADKICNVRDLGRSVPKDWSLQRCLEYLDWSDQVVAGCRGSSPGLEACYDQSVTETGRLLQQVAESAFAADRAMSST